METILSLSLVVFISTFVISWFTQNDEALEKWILSMSLGYNEYAGLPGQELLLHYNIFSTGNFFLSLLCFHLFIPTSQRPLPHIPSSKLSVFLLFHSLFFPLSLFFIQSHERHRGHRHV